MLEDLGLVEPTEGGGDPQRLPGVCFQHQNQRLVLLPSRCVQCELPAEPVVAKARDPFPVGRKLLDHQLIKRLARFGRVHAVETVRERAPPELVHEFREALNLPERAGRPEARPADSPVHTICREKAIKHSLYPSGNSARPTLNTARSGSSSMPISLTVTASYFRPAMKERVTMVTGERGCFDAQAPPTPSRARPSPRLTRRPALEAAGRHDDQGPRRRRRCT